MKLEIFVVLGDCHHIGSEETRIKWFSFFGRKEGLIYLIDISATKPLSAPEQICQSPSFLYAKIEKNEMLEELGLARYTPMMEQYLSVKKNYTDAFLFFRLGDFYEMFVRP